MAYKVIYFKRFGKFISRGEPIRYLLTYGGADFEDIFISEDDWPALKPDTPFGQLPLLEYEGNTAHQTVAICRYLAKQFKLAGKNDWEDLEIDAAVDTISDLIQKIESAKKTEGKDVLQSLQQEDVKYFLKTLDEQIKKNNGYFALGRLTWADFFHGSIAIQFLSTSGHKDLFADYPNIDENVKKVQNLPRIKEWLSKQPLTE